MTKNTDAENRSEYTHPRATSDDAYEDIYDDGGYEDMRDPSVHDRVLGNWRNETRERLVDALRAVFVLDPFKAGCAAEIRRNAKLENDAELAPLCFDALCLRGRGINAAESLPHIKREGPPLSAEELEKIGTLPGKVIAELFNGKEIEGDDLEIVLNTVLSRALRALRDSGDDATEPFHGIDILNLLRSPEVPEKWKNALFEKILDTENISFVQTSFLRSLFLESRIGGSSLVRNSRQNLSARGSVPVRLGAERERRLFEKLAGMPDVDVKELLSIVRIHPRVSSAECATLWTKISGAVADPNTETRRYAEDALFDALDMSGNMAMRLVKPFHMRFLAERWGTFDDDFRARFERSANHRAVLFSMFLASRGALPESDFFDIAEELAAWRERGASGMERETLTPMLLDALDEEGGCPESVVETFLKLFESKNESFDILMRWPGEHVLERFVHATVGYVNSLAEQKNRDEDVVARVLAFSDFFYRNNFLSMDEMGESLRNALSDLAGVLASYGDPASEEGEFPCL